MLLFIEKYPYRQSQVVRDGLTVADVLKDVIAIPRKEETITPEYVGYCYSQAAKDVIFILPKVVLTDNDSRPDTVFGASPEEIIDFDSKQLQSKFTEAEREDYRNFLSELSIWIYRTIAVYHKQHNDNILVPKDMQSLSGGKRRKHNTLLDVIIALRDFNRQNQDYFTFIAKQQHSGYNKVSWPKTIARSQAFIQDDVPLYINPVNKKKEVNFDEELLIIYFSILRYIHRTHGFQFVINLNYPLIPEDKLKKVYIDKRFGVRRLKAIRYKYFSDKALRIWDLCRAFFDRAYEISLNERQEDFLLAKDFEHIFEVMIDSLISEKQDLPTDLTSQKDGKLVDHMFIDESLIELAHGQTYYIGDSKYYKRHGDQVHLDDTSIYKQYTYARNVIQWNMNLFLGLSKNKTNSEQPQLRDPLTEGYNPIPNFFISARIPRKQDIPAGGKYLDFADQKIAPQAGGVRLTRQFENRLFDRDTLLLCHYDVNFLFIVSLYGRDNKSAQATWREYVRREFRAKIQEKLNSLYDFYLLQPQADKDCVRFIHEHFYELNGKIYRPTEGAQHLILALQKGESDWKKEGVSFAKHTQSAWEQSQDLTTLLRSCFDVSRRQKLTPDLVFEDAPNAQLDAVAIYLDVFAGMVKNSSPEMEALLGGTAQEYHTGPSIKEDINIMDIRYFAPVIGNKIRGYYSITGIQQSHKDGDSKESFRLYFKLGNYVPVEEYPISYTDATYGKMISKAEFKAL